MCLYSSVSNANEFSLMVVIDLFLNLFNCLHLHRKLYLWKEVQKTGNTCLHGFFLGGWRNWDQREILLYSPVQNSNFVNQNGETKNFINEKTIK